MFGRNCFQNEEESQMDKQVSDDVDMEDLLKKMIDIREQINVQVKENASKITISISFHFCHSRPFIVRSLYPKRIIELQNEKKTCVVMKKKYNITLLKKHIEREERSDGSFEVNTELESSKSENEDLIVSCYEKKEKFFNHVDEKWQKEKSALQFPLDTKIVQ
jgi:hypothetical protein